MKPSRKRTQRFGLVLSLVVMPVIGGAFSIRGVTCRSRYSTVTNMSRVAPSRFAHQESSSGENDGPPPPPVVESPTTTPTLGRPICAYRTVSVIPSGMTNEYDVPRQAVNVEDLTPRLRAILADSRMRHGVVHVISRHTTTAITINERESRLARDVANYFLDICPPDERSSSERKVGGVRYLHNDIGSRPDGRDEEERCRLNGWDIDDPDVLERWRDQEPINAHSHLISMMLGSSECIPVVDGDMVIGEWQSVLMIDLDGPRSRTVGVQLMGYE